MTESQQLGGTVGFTYRNSRTGIVCSIEIAVKPGAENIERAMKELDQLKGEFMAILHRPVGQLPVPVDRRKKPRP
jgi:hypothetical protein